MTTYKNLEVWKLGMRIVQQIYNVTKFYPKEELFALTSQTKRAAVSIPANIAEGIGRNYKRDTIQFLHISRGSTYELETLLNVATMINILQVEIYDTIQIMIEEEKKILNGLINSYEARSDLK